MLELAAVLQAKLPGSTSFSAGVYVPVSSAAAAAADKFQKRVTQVITTLSLRLPASLALSNTVPSNAVSQAVQRLCMTASLASDTWSMISVDNRITIESKVFEDVSLKPCFRGRCEGGSGSYART